MFPLSLVFGKGTRRLVHKVSQWWGKFLIGFAPMWSLEVEGSENMDPKQHYVIIANHQSMLDILVVLAGLKKHFNFMAKKELFSIPFLGWHMSLAKYIPVDRGSQDGARMAIRASMDRLDKKVSVLFFPEGTRSIDGEIKAFKSGAFKVAMEKQVPLLPVVIEGTADALPKNSGVIDHASKFRLRIGKPIELHLKDATLTMDALKETARESMIVELKKLRGLSS